MRKIVESLLKRNRYLPLSIWKPFKLKHGDKANLKENIKKIKKEVQRRKGLYVYRKDGRILYVGEGKLFDRINSHYRESLNMKRAEAWCEFFSGKRNNGEVEIYWKEEGKEENRKVLESLLEYVLNPKFPLFKKEFHKQKRNQSKRKQVS